MFKYPLFRCRAFAKGDLEGPPNDEDNDNAEPRTAEATFVPGHAILNARVAHLHARLPHDEHAQVYMRTPTYVKMKPTQHIAWTNHEIEDLKHTMEYTNSHLLAIARNIETLSKLIDSVSFNFMLLLMALTLCVGPWFISHIKLV